MLSLIVSVRDLSPTSAYLLYPISLSLAQIQIRSSRLVTIAAEHSTSSFMSSLSLPSVGFYCHSVAVGGFESEGPDNLP